MKPLLIVVAALAAGGCAWTPRAFPAYPSGRTIIRGDESLLWSVCSHVSDKGEPVRYGQIGGCFDPMTDTIYLLDSCVGAEALPHELAHEQGIKDPKKAGYNW